MASHQSPAVLALLEGGQKLKENLPQVSLKALTTQEFPSTLKSKKKKKKKVLHPSGGGVTACILPKVVILLHVLHVCCCEFGEVLGATIVHIVW